MKTREEIITSMCYTYRHDYGIDNSTSMTEAERSWLWHTMSQIFDNDIYPYMDFRKV